MDKTKLNVNTTVTKSKCNGNNEDQTKESAKINEKIFLLCDQCLWTVTCINRKYLEELSDLSETEQACPICAKDQLSSFPVCPNDAYKYSYSKNRGLEVTFKIK